MSHLVIVGGSDAGISAALRARELEPSTRVTLIVEDAFPNYSICGLPFYLSGEVTYYDIYSHFTINIVVGLKNIVKWVTKAVRYKNVMKQVY
jgi:NADPH-dependent 2,4-dienoyl-CoA reductase/sulfur reductase-like enzyme